MQERQTVEEIFKEWDVAYPRSVGEARSQGCRMGWKEGWKKGWEKGREEAS